VLKRFSTKYRTVESKMKSLSGGNQQRVVAARALAIQPNLILAFQPTRGLDIAGTSDVYAAIQAECDKGACALVVSFDLDELIERCDRVMAINRGTLHVLPEELRRDRQEIGQRMVME
jgi:simple sugar transport system ATP-binding protein